MKSRNFILLGMCALALVSCGSNKTEEVKKVKVEQVKVKALEFEEVVKSIELSTVLEGYEFMNIAPSVTGRIEEIYVEPGDRVKKGDMLVRMDEMQYKNAKLQYANLSVNMDRVDSLKASDAISQQSYDQSKLAYDQTKENLDFLEINTYVKARFDGAITAKFYEDGELYSGQPILQLAQIDKLKALVNVPEKNFPKIHEGMVVKLTSDIYPDKEFEGKVEIVYPSIDPQSHTFQVKLVISNKNEILRPGMYVKTVLPLGKEMAMIVPYQTVLKLVGANDRYVFINENGVAKRVFVKLGQRYDEMVEIISPDLKEGMEMVVVGQGKLVDGSKINIVR